MMKCPYESGRVRERTDDPGGIRVILRNLLVAAFRLRALDGRSVRPIDTGGMRVAAGSGHIPTDTCLRSGDHHSGTRRQLQGGRPRRGWKRGCGGPAAEGAACGCSFRRRCFEVITPQAIAAVRGTTWAVDVAAGKTSVFVEKGGLTCKGRPAEGASSLAREKAST